MDGSQSTVDVQIHRPDLDAAAAVWTVLSTAYGVIPQSDFVAALRSAEDLAHWPLDDQESRRGRVFLIASGADETWEEIVADHRRLFVGPRPLLAAPWESVYRSREGLVFGDHTAQVRAAYREFDLESPLLHREPDDHIALEATFVATLCLRALDATAASDDHQFARHVNGLSRFVQNHLTQWLPDLLERVEDHAQTDYHRGIAGLTQGAIDHLVRVTSATGR